MPLHEPAKPKENIEEEILGALYADTMAEAEEKEKKIAELEARLQGYDKHLQHEQDENRRLREVCDRILLVKGDLSREDAEEFQRLLREALGEEEE